MWGTYAKFKDDKNVQIETNRNRAYTQLKGQQAELVLLLEEFAVADDKANFYQTRAAQSIVPGNDRHKAEPAKGTSFQGSYLTDALQQERNAEHYADELVSCYGRIFESIGLIRLSFPPDPTLNEKIAGVESMLTRTFDIFPEEALRDRVLWAMTLQDAQNGINARQKLKVGYILKATQPISDLLAYLQDRLKTISR